MNNPAALDSLMHPIEAGGGLLVVGAGISLYHCCFGPISGWEAPEDPGITIALSAIALIVSLSVLAFRKIKGQASTEIFAE